MVLSGNQICSRVNACYKIIAVNKSVGTQVRLTCAQMEVKKLRDENQLRRLNKRAHLGK